MIPPDWLDSMAAPLIRRGAGVAIVGVLDSETAFRFHGRVGKFEPQPSPDTLFEIGALTQLFTSILLALAVREGRLRLDHPVADLVAEFDGMPKWVTPLRLASHTAGVPRVPPRIARRSLMDTRDPFAGFSTDDLLAWGATFRPRREPGNDAFGYSLLGMGLLGLVLADAYDAPFETLVQDKICAPLGLTDTVFVCTDDQTARSATPFGARGKPTPIWSFPGLGGASGLKSTARDISVLIDSILAAHKTETPLAESIANTLEIRRSAASPGGRGGGLGWAILHAGRPPTFIHLLEGRTRGSQAFILVAPGPQLGAAILSNRGPMARDVARPLTKRMVQTFAQSWSGSKVGPETPD